jgi:hypothetical protein
MSLMSGDDCEMIEVMKEKETTRTISVGASWGHAGKESLIQGVPSVFKWMVQLQPSSSVE